MLFIVAVLGLLVSGYLWFVYTGNTQAALCREGGGCDKVRTSGYGYIGGIPTPVFGVVYYIMLAVSAILLTPFNVSLMRLPLTLLTGAGFAVSGWLTYLEAFVIHGWCTWCVMSAILSVAAFIIVWSKLPSYARKY